MDVLSLNFQEVYNMVTSATPTNAPMFVIPQKQDYIQRPVPQPVQLDQIRAKLNLVLLAIKALTGISSDALLRVAGKLNIPSIIADEIVVVVKEGTKTKLGISQNQPLKLEVTKSTVLVICHLAKQNQALIRRAVALMEQMSAQNQKTQSVTLLREYVYNFQQGYQKYYFDQGNFSQDNPEEIALKLLIDLLFYSSPQGCKRLWSMLKS